MSDDQTPAEADSQGDWMETDPRFEVPDAAGVLICAQCGEAVAHFGDAATLQLVEQISTYSIIPTSPVVRTPTEAHPNNETARRGRLVSQVSRQLMLLADAGAGTAGG